MFQAVDIAVRHTKHFTILNHNNYLTRVPQGCDLDPDFNLVSGAQESRVDEVRLNPKL